MTGPVAVACYEGEWDASVDALHESLGFMPPPEHRSPKQKAQAESSAAAEPAVVETLAVAATVAVAAESAGAATEIELAFARGKIPTSRRACRILDCPQKDNVSAL